MCSVLILPCGAATKVAEMGKRKSEERQDQGWPTPERHVTSSRSKARCGEHRCDQAWASGSTSR
jgi:hypothetical protein